jgi:hypothetical protein
MTIMANSSKIPPRSMLNDQYRISPVVYVMFMACDAYGRGIDSVISPSSEEVMMRIA